MDQMTLKVIQSFHQYPCVSILLPTHRTSPENQQDAIKLKNLVKEAEDRLRKEYEEREIEDIITKMNELVASIDVQYNLDGQALFINHEFAERIDLPFPIRERVVIDNTFATRDLIMGMNRSVRYYVLSISGKAAHLYEAYRDRLTEIKNDHFPMPFETEITDTRNQKHDPEHGGPFREFLNQVDKRFQIVNKKEPLDLVITGVVRNLSLYEEVCDNPKWIIGKVEGNYEHNSIHEIGEKVWPQVKDRLRELRHEILDELGVAVGAKKVASGLDEVWQLSNTGRASALVVEENYFQPGSVNRETGVLTLVEDAKAPGIVDDVVDEIAEFVMHQGGRVVFVEDGRLKDHNRIALILRY